MITRGETDPMILYVFWRHCPKKMEMEAVSQTIFRMVGAILKMWAGYETNALREPLD